MLKKAWKIVLAVVLALLVVVLGYVAYVFIDYHRIGGSGADGGAERRCHRGGGERVRHPLL